MVGNAQEIHTILIPLDGEVARLIVEQLRPTTRHIGNLDDISCIFVIILQTYTKYSKHILFHKKVEPAALNTLQR